MSKAALIMDMPETCEHCDYCHTRPYDSRLKIDGEKFCGILNEDVEVYYYHDNGRLEWCPLKEIPKKKKFVKGHRDGNSGFICGWNMCLKEILGE